MHGSFGLNHVYYLFLCSLSYVIKRSCRMLHREAGYTPKAAAN